MIHLPQDFPDFEPTFIFLSIEEILVILTCKKCKLLQRDLLVKMSSIPYTAFSAKTYNFCNCSDETFFKFKDNGKNGGGGIRSLADRYSNKFMKSIWGLYNQYATHSFQKNSEPANMFAVQPQQAPVGIAANVCARSAYSDLLPDEVKMVIFHFH